MGWKVALPRGTVFVRATLARVKEKGVCGDTALLSSDWG